MGAIRSFRSDRRERSGGSRSTRPILTKIADLIRNTPHQVQDLADFTGKIRKLTHRSKPASINRESSSNNLLNAHTIAL